jgi:hypothetical protein
MAKQFARCWNIGLDKVKKTLKATTQHDTHMVNACFHTNDRQLWYRHLKTALYTGTMFASTVSTHGKICAQVFVNDLELVRSFPLGRKGNHTSYMPWPPLSRRGLTKFYDHGWCQRTCWWKILTGRQMCQLLQQSHQAVLSLDKPCQRHTMRTQASNPQSNG